MSDPDWESALQLFNNKQKYTMAQKRSKQWYQSLFENYGRRYDHESFTQGTAGECDFLEREAGFNREVRILDIGCGTGRHTVEMAKRGYLVTGVDLSESMLAMAREKAALAGVTPEFLQGDARKLKFRHAFDMVTMLCEGAFPLMETDEMNFRILKNAARALVPGGKLIFTTLNGLFPLFNSTVDFFENNTGEEDAGYENIRFDLMTFRQFDTTIFTDDAGITRSLECSERFYIPSEINWMLRSLRFRTIGIYGARLGAFSRDHKLTAEDFEMLVIAEK